MVFCHVIKRMFCYHTKAPFSRYVCLIELTNKSNRIDLSVINLPNTFTMYSRHYLAKLGKTKKIIYPSELFFFLYVSLNLPYVARLCASNLAKHIKKITSSFGVDYFLPLPLLTILLIFCYCFDANAQQAIQQKINEKFATTTNILTYAPLVETEANNLKNMISEAVLSKKQFFQIQPQQFQFIKDNKPEQLVLSLSIEGQQTEFQLMKAEIFSDDFQAVTASGTPLSQDMGVHYWGIIAGDANSLATFSFINNELVGGVHFAGHEYTLGKMQNSDTHILYNTDDLKSNTEYGCQELLPPGATQGGISINTQPLNSTAENCVRIQMEVDYSLYLSANSDAAIASNYVTAVFNEVAALYANETITVKISYLQVWDTTSPYGDETELDDLVAQGYGKTYGDLVHVVHTNSVGGLAYLGVICDNFYNAGVSGILGEYQNIPTYSWDVEVITHEIGHNLGSPHTHACAWNGNNTPIDGCGPAAGYDEGCNAALPNSGTIMSYCHLLGSVGIDFNLGFGQQPGDLIRSRVNSAFCLTECSVTCSNGNPGDACDDANACTTNDVLDDDCECAGTLTDADQDGICDADDICPQFDDALVGTSCDDGDACTTDDIYTQNCQCTGTFADADADGVCDADDICEFGDDNLDTDGDGTPDACDFSDGSMDSDQDGVLDDVDICPDFNDNLIGTPCDDGNACTVQDFYNENCECAGTYLDSDEDGVCNEEDACPDFDDELIGTSCDDGDACTVDDIYVDCECKGTFLDSDEDGVCDEDDICPDFNDNLIGTPCDDGNACTAQDFYNENCECAGTYLDSDEDGVCNEEDTCPDFDDELIGTSCDDGDACTTGDIYTSNCECAGTFADGDFDGVCDAEDICEFGDDSLDADGDGTPDACDFFDNTDSDGDGVPDNEDICPGGDDSIDVDENGTPDACEDCPTFNFIDYPVGTYGNSQDRGAVTTSNDGTSIELYNNAWKSITVDYEVTPYTVIEFDFKSTQIGEIHGLGFDNNTSISSSQTFKIYGTQNWGNSSFNNYTGSGEYEHYVIPVGEFYTGDFEYFFFVADHDSQPSNGNSFFANLKIYEDANQDGLCDGSDDCADADQDGVCDNDDVCPNGDDMLDTDGDGMPDACDICPENAENACDSAPDYCESSGNNANYEYIDRIAFGNIDNTSGNNNGYGDFTNQVANIGLGDIVPLSLTPGFANVAYNESWRVWIDFNKDGDFNDDGERIFSNNGAGSLAANIEIPDDATLGLTGMRVSMRWNRYAGTCSDFTYGEVEDYTVNITAESQNYAPLDLRGEEYLVEEPAMRIYPNPATDLITVNFQNIRDGGSIAIYNTAGQLISTHNITSEHLQLPIHKLPAGVYILHLNFGDGNYATERFVKLSE